MEMHHLTLLKFKLKEMQALSDSWRVADVTYVRFKKFLLRPNSVEVFFKDGHSLLLVFTGESNTNKCNDFVDLLFRLRKLHPGGDDLPQEIFWKPTEPSKLLEKTDLTKRWVYGEISNFEYLMGLNFVSGRSNHDLNQYPVIPWILEGYVQMKSSENHYRDLGKNMGCLGSEERREKFRKLHDSLENFKTPSHQYHFGFHYSNLPIVIQFLIRIQPFTQAAKHLQDGKFDVADRLFSSVSESYHNATR